MPRKNGTANAAKEMIMEMINSNSYKGTKLLMINCPKDRWVRIDGGG